MRLVSDNSHISTSALYGPSYLAHHGIKGQKWGVRRYMNEDGSLTPAGEARYRNTSYAKGLNRIDSDVAKTIHKKAVNEVKIQKAVNKGQTEKANELRKASEAADKAIASGRKAQADLLSKARSSGARITERDTYRYTNSGKMAFAAFAAGPFGAIPFAVVDSYRAATYGNEAGGIVKGTKYRGF